MPFIAGRGSSSKGYSGFARVPSVPAAPTVSNGCVNTTYNWTKPADNGLDITKYEYQVSTNDGAWSAGTEVTSLSHQILTQYNTNRYKIRVRAFNAYGWSEWSTASSNNIPWTIETDTSCTDGTCFDNTCTDGSCSETITENYTNGCPDCIETQTDCNDGTCSETLYTCNDGSYVGNNGCDTTCTQQLVCGDCGNRQQKRSTYKTRTRTRSRSRTRTRSKTRTRTRSRSRTRSRTRFINPSVSCTAGPYTAWTYSDGGSETVWVTPWVYTAYPDFSTISWVYTAYPDWSTIAWNYTPYPDWSTIGCTTTTWVDTTGVCVPSDSWVDVDEYVTYDVLTVVGGALSQYVASNVVGGVGWVYTNSSGAYAFPCPDGYYGPTNVERCTLTGVYRAVGPTFCNPYSPPF